MEADARILPAHIEETIRSIANLQANHDAQASPLQHLIDRLTAFIGRPLFLILITLIVFVWISVNLILKFTGFGVFDPPPFDWLQGVLALGALYMTVLILATQRYADQLAGHREQLTLELAILADQKTSKLIELVEEQRRDNPIIKNRLDPQADAMSFAADPEKVLNAIKDAHEENTIEPGATAE